MRGGGWVALGMVGVLLFSCGLETVPSLNPPDVNYNDTTLNGEVSLSFVHKSSRYAGSDFLGYQIFYKIYPESSLGNFSRLLGDRLAENAPASQLTNLGYQTLSFSSSSAVNSATLEPLLVQNLQDNDSITLDFDTFLKSAASDSLHPLLLIRGVPGPKPFLYRTQNSLTSSSRTFSSLRTSLMAKESLPADVASSITSPELNAKKFEMNVFIAAYGWTPTSGELWSSPVPWGVIRTIKE